MATPPNRRLLVIGRPVGHDREPRCIISRASAGSVGDGADTGAARCGAEQADFGQLIESEVDDVGRKSIGGQLLPQLGTAARMLGQ
ncbi:hypothetical protein [Nocardia mexicana]|uniref:hypothetical protein n=1 Tax=Nocardia mexicana TaxID=279262 RepID=UPI0011C05948|nr:hypothetical protein [Nocardia mexicana]